MPNETQPGSNRARLESSPILQVWLTRRAELERICLRWARGCRPDAEDLLSDAMMRALEAEPAEAAIASPRAWLVAIIANLGRDRWRRANQESSLEPSQSPVDELVASPALCDDALDKRRELARLFGRDSGLSSAQRQVLLARCLGESYRDIAGSLAMTEALARKLAQQAREQLRSVNAAGS